jgi:hypothetical protein
VIAQAYTTGATGRAALKSVRGRSKPGCQRRRHIPNPTRPTAEAALRVNSYSIKESVFVNPVAKSARCAWPGVAAKAAASVPQIGSADAVKTGRVTRGSVVTGAARSGLTGGSAIEAPAAEKEGDERGANNGGEAEPTLVPGRRSVWTGTSSYQASAKGTSPRRIDP